MTNYRRGRNLEYEVAKLFKDAGWTVTRAAGSHSPFDLIAIKRTLQQQKEVWFTVLMQCKARGVGLKGESTYGKHDRHRQTNSGDRVG
jgi:Holliday junction resolvase